MAAVPTRPRLRPLHLFHPQRPLRPWRDVRRRIETGRLVLYSLVAGALAGLLGCALRWALQYTLGWGSLLSGYSPPGTAGEGGLLMAFGEAQPYGLLALPPLAVISSWLTRHSAADPLSEAVSSYHRRASLGFWPQLKQLAGQVLSYSAGLPTGRDSVYTALGSLSATLLGRLLSLSRAEERSLTLACSAAALGLALHAPLAAAVLIAEVLYRRFEFEFEVLLPALLASVSAYVVYELVYGASPLFALPVMQVPGAVQLPLYALLGLLAATAAWLNTWAEQLWPQRWLSGWPRYLWAASLGGIVAAAAAFVTPSVLGGAGWMQLGLSGFLGPEALGYAAWKWLLLALGVRLGFGGGVLPSAVTGALLGVGMQALMPQPLDSGVCALVCAAAYLSVTLNIPVAATLLVAAWGGDSLLPTAFIAAGLGHVISGQLSFVSGQKRDRLNADMERLIPQSTILSAPLAAEDALLYRVAAPPAWQGLLLSDLPLPAGAELVALERGQDILLPASQHLQEGDILDIVASEDAFSRLREQLHLR